MSALEKAVLRQHQEVDAVVARFLDGFDEVTRRAALAVRDLPRVPADPGEALRTAMFAQGWREVVDAYVAEFDGQFVFFDEVLAAVNAKLAKALPPPVYGPAALKAFDQHKNTIRATLEERVEQWASEVRQAARLQFGALDRTELRDLIMRRYKSIRSKAGSDADTGISTFYRTINDRGYASIEDAVGPMRYEYDGPLDELNRPTCRKWTRETRAGKTWTRAMIKRLRNGHGTDVLTQCGGPRCRHQWRVAVSAAEEATARPAARVRPAAARESLELVELRQFDLAAVVAARLAARARAQEALGRARA